MRMSNQPRRMPTLHRERHRGDRSGWLRAAVLGANDGIVSTASLLIGVAAASGSHNALVTAGAAGLVAGACSMAMGEYVSVSSQRDTEEADIAKEEGELARTPELELAELTRIYERRGLDHHTAGEVARQLTAHDPLGAHLRDELGLNDGGRARPIQAAGVSAVSFAIGALFPVVSIFFLPGQEAARVGIIAAVAFVALAVSGALSGRAGGASVARGATRVLIGGGLAMVASALIGTLVGAAV
ncbi:MAG: putative rane protein [Actinomycetia bacterium]|nr:putative rane protein [Actinomycetes bacterium]